MKNNKFCNTKRHLNQIYFLHDDVQINQHDRPTSNSSDGRLERTKKGKTTGEHRWDAGQSSSDAFVIDLQRIINRWAIVFRLVFCVPCVFLF